MSAAGSSLIEPLDVLHIDPFLDTVAVFQLQFLLPHSKTIDICCVCCMCFCGGKWERAEIVVTSCDVVGQTLDLMQRPGMAFVGAAHCVCLDVYVESPVVASSRTAAQSPPDFDRAWMSTVRTMPIDDVTHPELAAELDGFVQKMLCVLVLSRKGIESTYSKLRDEAAV